MEMEEKPNPNSHEGLGRIDTPKSWSDLPPDLLNSVFERLSFANFQRAKSVCTSWHSASRQCVPKSIQIHWLVLFPEDDDSSSNNNHSCTFFDPEDKDKLYRTQDLDLEFAKSVCIATYRSWLLMQDPLYDLYIVNLFTHERINLPPTESEPRTITEMKRIRALDAQFRVTSHNGKEHRGFSMRRSVFWVDEKTKDYVVFWGLRSLCVVYSKKGDTSWNRIPGTLRPCNMVYKDSKLYMITSFYGSVIIFDFSGEIPQIMFNRRLALTTERYSIFRSSLVVTVTGDVLAVEKIWIRSSGTWSFRVVKVCSPGFEEEHEVIHSLGDESMLLDQGITVLADDNDGFIRNSIYFSDSSSGENTEKILLFNLETGKTEPVHTFHCSSSAQFSRARWFLPSFTRT
ncbi:unnamed protein product [Thlaspi arvense]|uniref:F-box domain-containing protein n=1 Tax=Thlaspi arvense TaxID=13288 RepID=A0AAU9T082_THLAR|nr:unnamed protein product [Thlaspi arvense]